MIVNAPLAELSSESLLVLSVGLDCIAEAVVAAKVVVSDGSMAKPVPKVARSAPRSGLCYGCDEMAERSVTATC